MRPEGDVAGGDEASRRFAGYLESAALLDVQDEVKAVERGEFAKRTRPDPFDVEILEKTRRQAQRRLSAGIVPMDPDLERGGPCAARTGRIRSRAGPLRRPLQRGRGGRPRRVRREHPPGREESPTSTAAPLAMCVAGTGSPRRCPPNIRSRSRRDFPIRDVTNGRVVRRVPVAVRCRGAVAFSLRPRRCAGCWWHPACRTGRPR